MKKIFTGILSALCAFILFNTETTVFADEQKTPSGIEYCNIGNEIDEYIKNYESGLASCEVAVFDDKGTIFSGYYGYSDIENSIPADETTVYEWGSCSKLLVWTSVMQLSEQGKLDLNQDIRTYLPDGFLTKLQYKGEKITMINLMNHDAGFQESYYVIDIFEPFVTENTARTIGHGSGMGLAIAKLITEKHGGKLSVRNDTHGYTKGFVAMLSQIEA